MCCVYVKAHPSKECFAVAEKGIQPSIIMYEYPSLRPFCILRGKWDQDAVSFSNVMFYWCFNFRVLQAVRRGRTALWILTKTGACWPAWGGTPTTCWRCGTGGGRRWCCAARPFLRRCTESASPHTTRDCSHRQDLDTSSTESSCSQQC